MRSRVVFNVFGSYDHSFAVLGPSCCVTSNYQIQSGVEPTSSPKRQPKLKAKSSVQLLEHRLERSGTSARRTKQLDEEAHASTVVVPSTLFDNSNPLLCPLSKSTSGGLALHQASTHLRVQRMTRETEIFCGI